MPDFACRYASEVSSTSNRACLLHSPSSACVPPSIDASFAKAAKIAILYFCTKSFELFESGREGAREQMRYWYSSRFFAALAASPISGVVFLASLTSRDVAENSPGTGVIERYEEVTPSAARILRQDDPDNSLEMITFRIEGTCLVDSASVNSYIGYLNFQQLDTM